MKHIDNYNNFSLNEYIQEDEQQLYRMLHMTDEEKYQDLAYQFPYLLDKFLNENYLYEFDEDEEEILSETDTEDYEKIEKLGIDFQKVYGKWIYENITNLHLDAEVPSWYYFSRPTILKNQWLIHLTDSPQNIARKGFTHGVNDIDNLALTRYIKPEAKSKGGFNFAYTCDDFDNFGTCPYKKGHGQHNFKYGEGAVMFKASGIKVWHSGDKEYQVIFLGKKAKYITPLEYDDDNNKWVIDSKTTNKPLVKKSKIKEIAAWLDSNFQQYFTHL